MTTDEPTICGRESCDRPADGWYICNPCTNQLTETLHDAGWMLDQLDTVIAGQTRYTDTAGKVAANTEIPLPYNPHAAGIRDRYTEQLTGWAIVILDANPDLVDEWPLQGDASPRFCAAWLGSRTTHIRLHPQAGAIADGITKAAGTAEYTIDRPPGKKYLGVCVTDWEGVDCGGRIYQRAGKPDARCDTCGGEYENVAELEAAILERLDSHLATAAEIAVYSTYMGLSIDRTQVRVAVNNWVRRKQLTPAQRDPVVKFRFIEARALLERAEKKRRENLQ